MVYADLFENLTGILVVTFLFGGGIIVTIFTKLSNNWRKVHESEHLASLKQSMIERGMSADEIERVLRAGTSDGEGGEDATELSAKLAEHGVKAPEMEQILNAFCAADAGTKKTLTKSVVSMLDNGAKTEQILVVVRALTRQVPAEQPHLQRFTDDASSFRH